MSETGDVERFSFDINGEARSHGHGLGMPQIEGESDSAYRSRIAGVLRGNGQIIEAHEVYSGRRWDDPEQSTTGPMAGIMGATAQVFNGHEYSPHDPERQIGDDIAAGVVVSIPDRGSEYMRQVFDLLGPENAVKFLLGPDDRDRT